MAAPLLLVDIDGVLNPWQAPECPDGFEEHVIWPEDPAPLRLSAAHARWLRELASAFELVWASAWGFKANQILCRLMDFPELPHVPFPPIPFEPAEKVPAIRDYAGSRPAAWIDDAIGPEARRWAANRRSPTLLMSISAEIGLTRAQVDGLFAWRRGFA